MNVRIKIFSIVVLVVSTTLSACTTLNRNDIESASIVESYSENEKVISNVSYPGWKFVKWSLPILSPAPDKKQFSESDNLYLVLTAQVPSSWSANITKKEYISFEHTPGQKNSPKLVAGTIQRVDDSDEPLAAIKERYNYTSVDRHGSFEMNSFSVMYDIIDNTYAYYVSDGKYIVRCASEGFGEDDYETHQFIIQFLQTLRYEEVPVPVDYSEELNEFSLMDDPLSENIYYKQEKISKFCAIDSSLIQIFDKDQRIYLQLNDGNLTIKGSSGKSEDISFKKCIEEKHNRQFDPSKHSNVFESIGWYKIGNEKDIFVLKAGDEITERGLLSKFTVMGWFVFELDKSHQSIELVYQLPNMGEIKSCEFENNKLTIIGKSNSEGIQIKSELIF